MLLAACGATTNAPATQTRVSEIVELTIAARTLPTQNAAVPPTPAPAPPTPVPVTATPRPAATQPPPTRAAPVFLPVDPPPLINGSWVAYSPVIHVRFFTPPSLVEDPEHTNGNHYALASPSNVFDFEALTIYRDAGVRGGDFASTWTNEMDAFRKAPNVVALVVTDDTQPQQVGAYVGNVGQFHYFQQDNDLKISGTMWVGQVGADEFVIIYRGDPERESNLDQEFAQVIRTIDFNAR